MNKVEKGTSIHILNTEQALVKEAVQYLENKLSVFKQTSNSAANMNNSTEIFYNFFGSNAFNNFSNNSINDIYSYSTKEQNNQIIDTIKSIVLINRHVEELIDQKAQTIMSKYLELLSNDKTMLINESSFKFIHLASYLGDIEIVKILIDNGDKIDNELGSQPIHFA